MYDLRGSVWRKWDLHVHTPASFHWKGGKRLSQMTAGEKEVALDQVIEKIVQSDVATFGIMDYWTFEGYIAIGDRLAVRKLKLAKAMLPGMELRIEAPVDFRLNIHVLLSDLLTKQQLQDFKAALRIGAIDRSLSDESLIAFARTLDESKAKLHGFVASDLKDENKLLQLGSMTAKITRESLREARKQIPEETCLVIMPYDTSDGLQKLDWERHPYDDNYFMQSAHIFETREPDNVDLFLGRETAKNRKFLHNFVKTMGGKPKPVISGSDAHTVADYGVFPSNRITWVKADPTFEGLRQTIYEPISRVAVSADKPLEPLLAIRSVTVEFPDDTLLVSESEGKQQSDAFCFRGKREIVFSPYLTCLIGGRGTGKSTLLNLIHEKLEPKRNRFFNDNHLVPQPTAAIDACVAIDGDTEKKVVEFLQQNEIERFAADPSRFTEAVFARLRKRDPDGSIALIEGELAQAIADSDAHAEHIQQRHTLRLKIAEAEKELAGKKALIASFEDKEYKAITAELGGLTRELQGSSNWRNRLTNLVKELRAVRERHGVAKSEKPNAYETEVFSILASIDAISVPIEARPLLVSAASQEAALKEKVGSLTRSLEDFLRNRGLSPENLSDVGKANERIAQLEQDIPALKAEELSLTAQIAAFTSKRHVAQKYADNVTTLLAPLNTMLAQLGTEVKPIALRYEFDLLEFRHAVVEQIQSRLDRESLRIDYLESMVAGIDFSNLTTQAGLLAAIPENQKTAKALREYFAGELNFELLRIDVERKLLDIDAHGRIRVTYDGKPVESSSFGQRCTAAIVILILLGNTPIVIDEPEAHLDSALIANYLVELVKKAKLNRQIIFATHNANFVINGDAELIHALQMGNDNASTITSTTIENLEYRAKLLALEGGKEAFQRRERRYGID